jgi:hypothetical protein
MSSRKGGSFTVTMGLLLSAAPYLLRPGATVCALAGLEYRCLGGVRGGVATDREADTRGVVPRLRDEDHATRRLGVLPGRADEVV